MLTELDLAPDVRGCVEGDWFVFLDLARDRYWAIARAQNTERIVEQLRRHGLTKDRRPARTCSGQWFSALVTRLPDWIVYLDAARWARRIERTRDLASAFAWIVARKAALNKKGAGDKSAGEYDAALKQADALRLWIPHRYVCLFDALCHCRFLLQRGFDPQLVLGVRGRPFAAHCWLNVDGKTIDAGQEDCASFAVIALA